MIADKLSRHHYGLFRNGKKTRPAFPADKHVVDTQVERKIEFLRKPIFLVDGVVVRYILDVGLYIRMMNRDALGLARAPGRKQQVGNRRASKFGVERKIPPAAHLSRGQKSMLREFF